MNRKWFVPAMAGLTAALVVLGAGVASAGGSKEGAVSQSGAVILDGNQTIDAFAKERGQFPLKLAPGVEWPETVPDFMTDPEANYEAGVVRGVATFYWMCSWEDAYLRAVAEGNKGGAASAVAQIARFPKTSFYIEQFVDPEDGWRKTILQPAQAGDPTGIREHFAGGDCAFYNQINS